MVTVNVKGVISEDLNILYVENYTKNWIYTTM
jgi:hypothetical protein